MKTDYGKGTGATSNFRQRQLIEAIGEMDEQWLVAMLPLVDARLPAQESTLKGMTTLMVAAQLGKFGAKIVKLMIPHSDINAVDEQSRSALWHAADSCGAASVKLLLEAGADANMVNNRGETPLIVAAREGSKETIEALILSSDVEARDKLGWTALMWAAVQGGMPAVEALLPACDPLARDLLNNRTAEDWARHEEKPKTAALIAAWTEKMELGKEVKAVKPSRARRASL